MRTTSAHIISRLLIVPIVLITFSLVVLGTASGHKFLRSISSRSQQPSSRGIEKRKNSVSGNEPVEIISAKTKNQTDISFGRKFDDDDEWIQGLTISVKNISIKPITYINIYVLFDRPDTLRKNDPPFLHSLSYGTKAYPAPTDSPNLMPGDSTDLILSDSTYESIKRALHKIGYPPNVKRLQMYVSEVVFEDGTMWANGYWYTRDPNDRNWIRLSRQRFAWPPTRAGTVDIAFTKVALTSSAYGRLTSPQSPGCGSPGAPYLQTCVGASNSDCMKEKTDVSYAPPTICYS